MPINPFNNWYNGHWYYGWNIVAYVILLQTIVIGSFFYSFSLYILPIAEEHNVTRSQVMLVLSSMNLLVGVGSMFAGKIIDNVHSLWSIGGGVVIATLGVSLSLLVPAFWQFGLLFAVCGATGVLFAGVIVSRRLVANWFIARRGLATGFGSLGTAIGGFTLPVLAGYLVPEIGWRGSLATMLVMVFLLLPLGWLVLRKEPTEELLEIEKKNLPPEKTLFIGQQWSLTALFRSRALWHFAAIQVAVMLTMFGIQVNLAVFAQDVGHSPLRAGTLLSLLFIAMAIGKVTFGALVDRISPSPLFQVQIFLYAIAIIISSQSTAYPVLGWAAILVGFSSGGISPMVAETISRIWGTVSFGTVYGVFMSFFNLSAALGPYLVSLLFDWTGSYQIAFSLLLLPLIVAFVLVYFLPSGEEENKPVTED